MSNESEMGDWQKKFRLQNQKEKNNKYAVFYNIKSEKHTNV